MTLSELRPTATIEDYLELIHVLTRDGETIIAARLAEMLSVSAPTVTLTLKRMIRDGWISVNAKKEIQLTRSGEEAAASVIRRHMLTEVMLAKILNVPWSQVHAEAHHIEHTISDEVEARLRNNLSEPTTCPHGNPLPGYEDQVASWIPLVDLPAGATGILRRIHELAEDQPEILNFLEQNDLLPGTQFRVIEVLPYNQVITLDVGGRKVSFGFSAARYLFVER